LRIFLGFSDTGVDFGTTVMARRTDRWDRGGAGFPSWWQTAALGRHAWVMARVPAVPAGFAARAPRGKESTEVSKGGKGAQQENFENTHDLLGDLLGAKNAGITRIHRM
jgi:hypothetical protein